MGILFEGILYYNTLQYNTTFTEPVKYNNVIMMKSIIRLQYCCNCLIFEFTIFCSHIYMLRELISDFGFTYVLCLFFCVKFHLCFLACTSCTPLQSTNSMYCTVEQLFIAKREEFPLLYV
jgi:hypothetical protein